MALVPFASRQSTRPRDASTLDGLLADFSLLDRLDDFRRRLIRCAIAVCVGVGLGFGFINQVIDFILAPTRRALPAGSKLIYTQPGEAFGLTVQIALLVGVVAALPYIMFQCWKLVAPIVPRAA